MKKDALIDEIRAVRHEISEQFAHDTEALVNHYRELEKEYKDRMIKPKNDIPSSSDSESTQ